MQQKKERKQYHCYIGLTYCPTFCVRTKTLQTTNFRLLGYYGEKDNIYYYLIKIKNKPKFNSIIYKLSRYCKLIKKNKTIVQTNIRNFIFSGINAIKLHLTEKKWYPLSWTYYYLVYTYFFQERILRDSTRKTLFTKIVANILKYNLRSKFCVIPLP